MATMRVTPARRRHGKRHPEDSQTHGLLLSRLTTNSLFLQEIEAFQRNACELGLEIQDFVRDISKLDALARIPQDFTTFELDKERVQALQQRRRQLQRRLSSCESCGVDLRKRLRELRDPGNSEEEEEEAEKKNENISSLDLPTDRSSQILVVEQYIIQLSETRSKLRKFWIRYARGLRNLKTLENFENHFKKLQPLLGVWQSLIDSVSDYLSSHSGAPLLLPVSSSSFSGTSDTSDETDSAVVMEDTSAPNTTISSSSNNPEDPVESLLAIQARAKKAQASGVVLLEEIVDLIARGENIRDEANGTAVLSPSGDLMDGAGSGVEKRMSWASCSSLLARMNFEGTQIDPLVDEVPLGEDIEFECADDLEDFYGAVDANSLTTESDKLSLGLPPDDTASTPPLVCLLPEYAEARIACLRKLETLARTGLSKSIDQLERLIQLYTEINEARQWISKGNNLNSPLTLEHIAEMDQAACEETIKQLSAFCESREANLVLKGDPGQFRKQFSDLLNAEMKPDYRIFCFSLDARHHQVELSQMLRLVEEVEHSLRLTIANLRQQISRSTYPIKTLLPATQQHQSHSHQHHHQEQQQMPQSQQQNGSSMNVTAQQPASTGVEQELTDKEVPEHPTQSSPQPSFLMDSKLTNEKLFQRALQELINTEANHIKFLEAATQAFSVNPGDPNLPRLPSFIRENRALLIVNLPEQLAFHKNIFYPQLLACKGDPFLIQQWAESSWANLVDLYTAYCLNYERATQYATAFEKDRIHSQWISAYNRYLNSLEAEKTPGNHLADDEGEKVAETADLRKVANLNRANSCITFDNNQSPDRLAHHHVSGSGAEDENEENHPPASRKNSQGSASSLKLASFSRPLLPYSSRLLEPAQRFQRYHLLIDRLKNYAPEGAQKEALTKAHRSMLDMCDTVNVLMRIRGLTDRPSRLGRLLLQDTFTVWCSKNRNDKHQRYVFLFENALLLTKLRQFNTSLVSTVLASLGGSGASSSNQPMPTVAPDAILNGLTNIVITTQESTGAHNSSEGDSRSALDSPPASLPVIPADASSQRPMYEIKMVLKLTEVGLTPTNQKEQRYFEVWTASRDKIYCFQTNNYQVRSQWVRAINGLLSAQLSRLRDDAHRQKKNAIRPQTSVDSHLPASNLILRADSDETDDFEEQLDKEGNLTWDIAAVSVTNNPPSKTVLKLADSEESSPKSTDLSKNTDSQELEASPTLQPSGSFVVDQEVRTLRDEQTTLADRQNLTPESSEDSSNCTSLDLSSGPTSPLVTTSTTDLFVRLFKPSIEKLDEVVATYLLNQSSLKALLEDISRDISETSYQIVPPVDIQQYIQKINIANHRLQTVEANLLRVKTRIQALQTKIGFSKNRAFVSAASAVFPCTHPLEKMARLEWLKLRNSQLTNSDLPSELKYLNRLEYLSLAKNKLTRLTSITDWPKVFPNLRVLNCRKNQLASTDAIPPDLFSCPNLQVIDFSCNQLTQVPRGIENASGLLVLNLSDNQLTSVPAEIFTECTELMLLDLSDNSLTVLPAQLRRCSSLQQLILNNNPFQHYQPRTIIAIKNLEVLHMSGTQRRLDNIPKELDRLTKLADLDLSHNQLVGIPEPVFDLRALRKLDLSYNEISEMTALTDNWPCLEYLNLSHNQLCSLPAGLTRLTKLRKLYLQDNQLTFSGLPSGMAKLNDLEVLNASNNRLENIPEGLCRCGRLKRLILSNNELETLPDTIHFLIENLEKFDVDNNPKLRFPPKPLALQKGAGLAFYNIDFSLDGQLQMMRGITPEPSEDVKKGKESAARLKRMRRRRLDGGENTAVEDVESSGQVVLAGMRHIAGERDAIMRRRYAEAAAAEAEKQAKRWKDALAKPNLDYSDIFDEDAGTQLGVEIWVIDEFYPKRFEPEDEEYVGQLFSGDCYILLQTREVTEVPKDGGATGNREWRVFYWIGSKASLDKRACVAMHAVNLRNYLGIDGQTQREEQGDESPEFLALFPRNKIQVLEGSSGSTGFHIVACKEAVVRMYRLFGQEKTVYMVSMPVSPTSLDPKFVYLVDGDSCLYVWFGSKSRLLIQTRGRLLAEKIAQKERLNEATISLEQEGRESTEFWAVVMGLWKPAPRPPAVEHQEDKPVQAIIDHPKPPSSVPKPPPARDYISVDWKLPQPILYDVKLGKGYLELLQVDLLCGQLTRDILNSGNVYLLDSGGELFVWMGKKSARFLRYAGFKLAEELTEMMPRGCFGGAEESLIDEIVADNSLQQSVTAYKRLPPQPCPEGAESEIFRAQFVGWEPAMAVDFTRTARSVTERGADPNVILERDQIKTDLRALLAPRETPLPWDKAIQLMNDLNYELIEPLEVDADFSQGSPTPSLQQFVILDRKWAPVDPQWFGHFFNKDSYIVIARYWDDEISSTIEETEKKPEDGTTDKTDGGEKPEGQTGEVDDENVEEEEATKTVVYFWQGREASELAWLTFNFSLRKDMEARLSRNPNANGRPLSVEFKRVKQQQEDMYFMAHFLRKMVIHSGSYRDRDAPERSNAIQFYHLRMNGTPIATRCIQVKPAVQTLNSCFSYILRVPKVLTNAGMDKVYVWIGKSAHPDDTKILQSICDQIYDPADTEVSMLSEGEEPEIFWRSLGGQGKYDQEAEYMNYSRLFRLSNDAGYFHASEKCADFCQDDLVNDDVMMLDNGEQIYLWLGRKTSDVEVKLSLQAAKLYKEHMSRAQPSRPRQLKLTAKNAEPFLFRRCFHGWGPFYEPKDWSG
ncbi:hypothetical protein Aperf_G00000097873 [Anoplocephala perfoliata]